MTEIRRKSSIGIEQKIWAVDLKEDEMQASFNLVNGLNSLLEEDQKRYSDAIYIPHWREILLALPNVDHKVDPRNLELSVVTSYHVQALRKGKVNDITPLTVLGLVLTKDNKLIYGIRGGSVGSGEACAIPGGHVPYCKERNPVFAGFYSELLEETGIKDGEVEDVKLIGYQTDPRFKSVCFIMKGKTDFESYQLDEFHKRAMHVYNEALKAGKLGLEARDAIGKAGFTNIDAWENEELTFVDNDEERIRQIIESGELKHRDVKYKVFDNSVGALIAYQNSK